MSQAAYPVGGCIQDQAKQHAGEDHQHDVDGLPNQRHHQREEKHDPDGNRDPMHEARFLARFAGAVILGRLFPVGFLRPHVTLSDERLARRARGKGPYDLDRTPSSLSLAAMSEPWAPAFTALSINKIFPSFPM